MILREDTIGASWFWMLEGTEMLFRRKRLSLG